jgi:thymidylate synthase (FAD)
MHSINLSKQAVDCLKKKIKGEEISFESSGMSKREWNEFREHFPEVE